MLRLPSNLFQLLFFALMIAAGCGSSVAHSWAEDASPRPNILFVFTDDQRHDALGCAGNDFADTPNLDRLAARGVRFQNAFVTLSICSPSRAACLTGRYGSANGVTTLGRPLASGEKTFAHYLEQRGYKIGMIGKWHLATSPEAAGFDTAEYFVSNGPYYNRKVRVDGQSRKIPGFIDDWVAERSIAFIESAAAEDAPFLLWMCTQVPHMDHTMDWNARPETLRRFDAANLPLPRSWRDSLEGKPPYLLTARNRTQAQEVYGYASPENLRRHIQRYYAAVAEVDASIGRTLDAVERLGLDDNTWILFMGDNGWLLGEHGMTSKVLPYEESIRVPMMVAGPDCRHGVDDRLVLNVDLMATILDLAGVEPPANIHGRSLLPLVLPAVGETPITWRDALLYEAPTPSLGSHPLWAIRTAEWKYIETCQVDAPSRVAFCELYDLRNDPHEEVNLAGERPTQVRELASRLTTLRRGLAPAADSTR